MILMSRLRSARLTKVLEKAGEMSVYESAALPTELRRLFVYFVQFTKWLEGGCCTSNLRLKSLHRCGHNCWHCLDVAALSRAYVLVSEYA